MSDTNQNSCGGNCGGCGSTAVEAELDETTEEIMISMEEVETPVAAAFGQFIESVGSEEGADEDQVTALRAVYFAGALDILRLIKSGVTIVGENGEPMQQGYSLFELEAEVREDLGMNEGDFEEEEISAATKQVIGNIVDKTPE